jgi:hypothetical protein
VLQKFAEMRNLSLEEQKREEERYRQEEEERRKKREEEERRREAEEKRRREAPERRLPSGTYCGIDFFLLLLLFSCSIFFGYSFLVHTILW